MNGNFYFSFYFYSDVPADQIAPYIRLYGNNTNDATFDGDRGNGAQWVPIENSAIYNLSGITTNVYGQVNPTLDGMHGGSLRHLYRARLFSINELGFTPHTIRYYVRTNATSSFFCVPGIHNCYGYVETSLPYILFNRIPESNLGYHEYGHWIEYDKTGYSVTDGGSHYFELQTTHNTAWTEGWAEFYNAGTHEYWYRLESPSVLEHLSRSGADARYEFIDAVQTAIVGTSYDNTRVEGAIACFIYSLWDRPGSRILTYSGDNDDLALPGGLILGRLHYNYTGVGASRIEKFKNGLLDGISFAEDQASVNALYSALISQSGNARPAGPTVTSASGTSSSRTITWNDNTCPTSLTYYREGSAFPLYYSFAQNPEQGFRIFRKAGLPGSTFTGFSQIGSVGPNITNFVDSEYLPPGTYSYAVLAYNAGGNSTPRGVMSISVTDPLIVTMSGPTTVFHPQKGTVNQYTWTANVSGGTAPYSYAWTKNGYSVGANSSTYTEYYSFNGWDCGSYQFTLRVDVTGGGSTYATKTVTAYNSCDNPIFSVGEGNEFLSLVPEDFSFGQNYPNPFNPETEISFGLPEPSSVRVTVYDMLGREIITLVDKQYAPGFQRVTWNGRDRDGKSVGSGVYFYRVHATGESGRQFVRVMKMSLTR